MRITNPSRAFTILEVLVSLAIFYLAAIALGAGYANILQNIRSAKALQEESGDLRTIRALLLAEPDRKKVEQGGDVVSGDGKHLHWEATIADTRVGDLFGVTLVSECIDNFSNTSWKRSESFMVLRPSWSEGVVRDKLRAEAKARLENVQVP